MRQKLRSSVQLPQKLLDELKINHGRIGQFTNRAMVAKTRKQQRKAIRKEKQAKSVNSSPFCKTKQGSRGQKVDLLEAQCQDRPPSPSKEINSNQSIPSKLAPNVNLQSTYLQASAGNRERLAAAIPRSLSEIRRKRVTSEDREIEALERALGIQAKDKNLPQSFAEDGLDDIIYSLPDPFMDLDSEPHEIEPYGSNKQLNKKQQRGHKRSRDLLVDAESNSGQGQESFEEFNAENKPDVPETSFQISDRRPQLFNNQSWEGREDPYKAPHPTADAPELVRHGQLRPQPPLDLVEMDNTKTLQRKTQGILNRLSEANMLSTLTSVESLYREYPRQHVTNALLDHVFRLLCDSSILEDTFIILQGGFIAAVFRSVGPDFGAQALQRMVTEVDKHLAGESCRTTSGKQVANIIGALAELYNYHVIASTIIYDYVRWLVTDLSEQRTELLLKIIRNCGSQLRRDDPSSLREIVLLLQAAVAQVGADSLSVRSRFMMETIQNLGDNRNSRLKIGSYSSIVASEHRAQMRKVLGGLSTDKGGVVEALSVSLEDVRDSDKRGKWWLTGASHHDNDQSSAKNLAQPSQNLHQLIDFKDESANLLTLAKEQRMNTGIRRSIFITIMSASDHKDACDRLLKLRLKKPQALEIPKVLIQCVAAEKIYNPYYYLVAKQLCADRRLKIAFKFSLWKLLDRLETVLDREHDHDDDDDHYSLNLINVVHLAKMFGHLMFENCVEVKALKSLNFAYMKPGLQLFVEVLLATIFLGIGHKCRRSSNLEKRLECMFRKLQEEPGMIQGLQIFLKRVMRKTDVVNSDRDREVIRRSCGIVENALLSLGFDSTAHL